jgi:hypothetical protein
MTMMYFICVKHITNIVVTLVGYLYIMVHYPINKSILMVPVLSQHIQSVPSKPNLSSILTIRSCFRIRFSDSNEVYGSQLATRTTWSVHHMLLHNNISWNVHTMKHFIELFSPPSCSLMSLLGLNILFRNYFFSVYSFVVRWQKVSKPTLSNT